jgi:hydrogenase maturation protease
LVPICGFDPRAFVESKLLVLGIGNPLLSDDGFGPAVLARVRRQIGEKDGVEFVDVSTGSLRLAEEIADHEQVVLIDAFATGEAEPGTMYELILTDTGGTYHLSLAGDTPPLDRDVFINSIGRAWSAHEVDLMMAIKLMVRDLGRTPPKRIYVFGVEAQDVTTFSEELTDRVSESVETVAESVGAKVRALLDGRTGGGDAR